MLKIDRFSEEIVSGNYERITAALSDGAAPASLGNTAPA
jgi:hypothetical protein